jgi:hypothetical protein
MSGTEPAGDIVCPLWDLNDHRFRARHYAAWQRKCRCCGREVAVSRLQKEQAEKENLQFLCQQCDLVEKTK